MKRLLLWFFEWAGLVFLWMLFISKWDPTEFWLGVITSAIALFAGAVVGRQNLAPFSPQLSWLAQAWRIPGNIVEGTWNIFKALARELFSKDKAKSLIRAVPYDVGGEDGASTARRVLAITYTTCAPNFIIIGIVRKQGLMLYHQVLPSEVPEVTRKLGAKA